MKLRVFALMLAAAGAQAQQAFVLESAVIDSRTGANLGVSTERGEVAALFRAQKALTFGILRSAGVDLNALPTDVRARIERFQTTNLAAFRAYSDGLDLKDQGRFAEARALFQRAAELDPAFELAADQQQAMPEITLNAQVQLRAALSASAGQAVSRGQASFAVDAQRAIAAAQGGLVVTQGRPPTDREILVDKTHQDEYGGQSSGTGSDRPNLATVVSFGLGEGASLAQANEWKGDEYRLEAGEPIAVQTRNGQFGIARDTAVPVPGGSLDLADGSRVYWGRWLSSSSGTAAVKFGQTIIDGPTLGALDWIAGEATLQLPRTGVVSYAPAGGGSLTDVSGRIAVDFQLRSVTLQNLGFTLDGLVFSGLQGSATMREGSPSGLFSGPYTGGTCSGCTDFLPTGSGFGGNFVGRDAAGMLFGTTMRTGGGDRSGVTVLRKEP